MKFYIQIPSDGKWGNPVQNTDFDVLSKEELNAMGWYEYLPVNAPEINSQYKLSYTNEVIDNVVKMIWTKELKTGKELAYAIKAQWAEVRSLRTQMLFDSDYTQMNDTTVSESEREQWKIYRQALRDITTQPDPFNIVFPTSPKNENLNIGVYRVE
jgi:hypothetical protein